MDWKTRRIIYKIRINQFFRNLKLKLKFKIKGLPKWEQVDVIEYPDCFLVITLHTLKSGGGIHTELISKINKDNNVQFQLAPIVLQHLDKSKWGVDTYDRYKALNKIAKITGRKSIKDQMKDAKMISISRNKGLIKIQPSINGGSTGPNRGYRYEGPPIILELPVKEENFEIEIKRALEMCL
ncbi:hypothetical protein [Allomuricauda sp. M10]|uniref:hypothetical protein n=1 Tax=Allomuricauda sp. M10 TaxID=2683292 RepID=UPI001D18713F|nr:hypothetical protein [Muricauda sp. M10]